MIKLGGLWEAFGVKPKADPVIALTVSWCPGFEHQVTARSVLIAQDQVTYHPDETATRVCIPLSKVDRIELEVGS